MNSITLVLALFLLIIFYLYINLCCFDICKYYINALTFCDKFRIID